MIWISRCIRFKFISSVDDYDASTIPSTIVIPAGMSEGCFDMDIIDDDVNEPQQSFQLTASIQGSTTPQATTTVAITDDDGRIGIYRHIYGEVFSDLSEFRMPYRYKCRIRKSSIHRA